MTITRNEFLKLIVEAHINALEEMGHMDFWVDQYYLWTHENVRDGRIHDTTAKVMIPYEAAQANAFKFDVEFDNGQTHQFTQASDGLTDQQVADLESQFSSKLIAGCVTDANGTLVNYWNDDVGIEQDEQQPTEYEEWQDYMGGDDWDHGQYDYDQP